MSTLILWLDTEHAKMFFISPVESQREEFRGHGPLHPPETLGRNHTIDETDEERFYRQLSRYLKHREADEWLLLGPGQARQHFQRHLERHHPAMARRILASEPMDQATDAEILARGREFFRHHRVFQGLL